MGQYSISESEVEVEVDNLVKDILQDRVNWNYAFGETNRRNGHVVTGNPRDTIDTRETIENFNVDVEPDKIRVTFSEADAEYIFKWREEMGSLVVDELVEEFSGDLAAFVIESYFKD
jgi:hypothetical protein